jgi:hypothetical protein
MPKFRLIFLTLSITLLSACGGGGGGCSAGFGSAIGGSGICDKSSPSSDSAPLAVAGADQSVLVGSTVTLDGSNSRDPDGKPLTYLWTLRNKPTGSTAALSSANTPLPTFVADKPGPYVAQLVVNDGSKSSALAFITIMTAEQNAAPVANAGLNQKVKVGNIVTLDGSFSSDANRDALVFTWKLVAPPGSNATLSSTSAVRPTFTADKDGNYVAYLTVSDGTLTSNIADVNVEAQVVNSAPTARIGAVAPVAAGKTITLDGGTSSDPDRDPLTYTWVLISQPTGAGQALSSTTVAKPMLQVSEPGNYVASLVVNDSTANSDYAFITLTALAAPLAKAQLTDGTDPITGDIPSGTVPSSSGQLSWAPQWTAVGASEWLPFQIGTPYVSIAVRESQTEQSLSMMLIDVRLIEAPLLGEALHAVTDGMRFQDGSWVFPIEQLATENYVQRAVRHQPLTEDHGLYVQHAVRASQLEAAVRMRAADVWFLLATDINDTFNPFALNSTNPMQRGDLSVLQGSVL